MLKASFAKVMLVALSSSLVFSCSSSIKVNAPYLASDTKTTRNRVVQTSEPYALILAPTKDSMSVLDLVDNRILFSVATGRNPVELSISPDKRYLLVANKLDGTISAYFRQDRETIRDLGTFGNGENPTDVIFNNKGTEAYVAYQGDGRINFLSVLNRAMPVSKQVLNLKDESFKGNVAPFKLAISKDDNTLYSIDKDNGKLFVFKKQNNSFTQSTIINLAINNEPVDLEDIIVNNDKIYISDSINSKVIVVDAINNTVINSISLLSKEIDSNIQPLPTKLAITADSKKLYVTNRGTSTIAVLDLEKNTLLKHISLSSKNADSALPTDISIRPNGNIYITNSSGRNISIISGKDDKLIRNIGTTPSEGFIPPLSAIKML